MTSLVAYNPVTKKFIPNAINTFILNDISSTPMTFSNKTISALNNTINNIGHTQLIPTLSNQINNNTSNLSNHISDISAHGVSGDVVGTTDTQQLFNKILSTSTIAMDTKHADKIDTFTNSTPVITKGNGLSLGGGGSADFYGNSISGSLILQADGTALSDTVMINFEWSPGWNSIKSYSVNLTATSREATNILPHVFIEKFDTNWNIWNTGAPPTVGEVCSFDFHILTHEN